MLGRSCVPPVGVPGTYLLFLFTCPFAYPLGLFLHELVGRPCSDSDLCRGPGGFLGSVAKDLSVGKQI
jgi:hypothetical protein